MNMPNRASYRLFVLSSLALCGVLRAHAQLEGASTLLCGGRSGPHPPANISVTSNEGDGASYVHFDVHGATKTLTMRAVDQMQALCSLPGNNVAIFGGLTAGASVGDEVAIARTEDGTLLDSWDAYTPVMSPDQRWIILRKFYAPQTVLTTSEEYLLYPLWMSRTRDGNGECGHSTEWHHDHYAASGEHRHRPNALMTHARSFSAIARLELIMYVNSKTPLLSFAISGLESALKQNSSPPAFFRISRCTRPAGQTVV